ncbi:hypothetical protein BJX61DRAFT_541225 [Aspergillus egyptiacus]|nr:hypothetical protein BJX61DRAFT_541225 [Aspergillus egyptiacus]
MSLAKTETDIILNKANIALARSQRLVASWLPVQTPADESSAKPDDELQREEDEIFTAVPETANVTCTINRLGLGAPLPSKAADGSWNRTGIDSNDQLRRQLLGRNYKKVMAEKARQKNGDSSSASGSSAKISTTKGAGELNGNGAVDEDAEDDEGRTALIGGKKDTSKKRKTDGNPESTQGGRESESKSENSEADDGGEATSSQRGAKSKGRKKATSFLDEILAERSKKRMKR